MALTFQRSKKINKSQINEDDITFFILNDLKKTVQESYKRSSIIHLLTQILF